MSIIMFLVIGGIAGWLAGRVINGAGSGIILNVIFGVIGALIGGRLFEVAEISLGGLGIFGALISAFVGALLFLWLIKLIRG